MAVHPTLQMSDCGLTPAISITCHKETVKQAVLYKYTCYCTLRASKDCQRQCTPHSRFLTVASAVILSPVVGLSTV